MLHSFIAAGSSPAASTSQANDRGIIHQLLIDLGVSPSTAHAVQVYAVGPLRILLVIAIAVVLSWLVKRLSGQLVKSLRLVSPLVRATPRGEARACTLAGVFSSLFRTIIWVIALLTILGLLDINLVPFVATATVVGAALGFGAQSLVRDFLSGVLILAEDQFGVGDSIVVGSGPNATTGMVEGVNLRTTRIRGPDGVSWYVPNGEIRILGNNTDTDSEALVDVVVPLGTDLAAAADAAEQAARQVASDPEWEGVFLTQPRFSGVESSDHDGATLRLTARTRPGEHIRAARALRLRVLERLRSEGLAWAADHAGGSVPGSPQAGS